MKTIQTVLILISCLLISLGMFSCSNGNDREVSDATQPANALPSEPDGNADISQKSDTTEPTILSNEAFMEMCIAPDTFRTIDALHHVLSGKGGELSQYQVQQTKPVTYYYVPDFLCEGFALHHTLLTTNSIQYYYVPENQVHKEIYQLYDHDMIIMTVSLYPVSSDDPNSPEKLLHANTGNYVQKATSLYYSAKYSKVVSYETGHYIGLSVPDYMNDYDILSSLCKVRMITLNSTAVTE